MLAEKTCVFIECLTNAQLTSFSWIECNLQALHAYFPTTKHNRITPQIRTIYPPKYSYCMRIKLALKAYEIHFTIMVVCVLGKT